MTRTVEQAPRLYAPLYYECVARRQWQDAANVRGCSEDVVRMEEDPVYVLARRAGELGWCRGGEEGSLIPHPVVNTPAPVIDHPLSHKARPAVSRVRGRPSKITAQPVPREYAGGGRRHVAAKVEPERVRGLAADHPAVIQGRTLFPTTVVTAMASPRILVSGEHSSKLGKVVEKGPWKGMPIFQVTLEERKTCPRSCPVFEGCYGNGMLFARRHDATDPDFMVALWSEVVSTYRAVMNQNTPPAGMVVRLHVLGDFFSTAYVQLWADLLDELPHLHVFGYTARREDADDDESRRIAKCLRWLSDQAWDRFAIRFSREVAEPQGTFIINDVKEAGEAIVCPAQTGATASCATCGLCWSAAARARPVAFLRHGIKSRGKSIQITQQKRRDVR